MDLQEYLVKKTKLVDDALEKWLPAEDCSPELIHQAMRYSVFAGGKRLRPVLVLAACESIAGTYDRALPAACALELIHTYSLIHDDLPAMDDDDFRRGKPTSHRKFGEAIAILAGDALLTYAFELLARESLTGGVNPGAVAEIIREIAWAAGTQGMVGGQVLDLAAEGKKVDLTGLKQIHRWKTGALLTASVRVGAIIGGANPQQLDLLTGYAQALGLAFQIKDDILDVEGDTAKLGKTVGSDLANDKSTYPSILGLDQAKAMLDEQVKIALGIVDKFGEEGKVFAELALFVKNREC